MAEQARPPKKEIPGIELKVAARKALEITAVVINNATPTVRKDRSMARRTSAPSRRSRINRIRKWMVSSTAIPRQILKVRTLLKRLVERVEKTGVKEQGEGIGNDT